MKRSGLVIRPFDKKDIHDVAAFMADLANGFKRLGGWNLSWRDDVFCSFLPYGVNHIVGTTVPETL